MQGRLKSIVLKSSQEAWQLDLGETAVPAVHGQPQPPIRVPISITSQKRAASASGPSPENDDDGFMPPTKQHARARASSSTSGIRDGYDTSKPPSVRCVPSLIIKCTEYLNMPQRTKITGHGFGGLLQFYAEELHSTDLLVYLMDKLNSETMILEVGNDGGLEINELSVKTVFEIPCGALDPPSSTEEENALALADFRKSVNVERNKEVKCSQLLSLLKKLNIDNELAVRIFFVVAFNKLIFPAIDQSIRGRDAFLTKDLSQFSNINWCKAVIDDLRHAAITWRSEKKKSIPGCGIFLIIFYLDNLDSCSSIDHLATPRAKYFHKHVMEKLITEDQRRDRFNKVTYGNLQLKNISNTCYKGFEPTCNGVSVDPMFPGAEDIGVLLSQLASSSLRDKVANGFKQFNVKASQAINILQSGSQKLVDAHNEFLQTVQIISVMESAAGRSIDKDTTPTGPDAGNQSSLNNEFSFFQRGTAHNGETYTHHQSTPCFEPHNASNTDDLSVEREATSYGQTNEPEYRQTVAHENGRFEPGIDNILEDSIQRERTASGLDNDEHIYQDVHMASIDRTIPDVHDPGCSEPTTPMHIDNPQVQYVDNMEEVQCASIIVAARETSNEENAESAVMPTTHDKLGINKTRARPRIDRLVNVTSRYRRSPFKSITPRPAVDMVKARAVRKKICTVLKNRSEFIFFGITATKCQEVAEYFADGGRLHKSVMNFFVECIRAEEEYWRPNCVGSRVFLSGNLGEMLNHDEEFHKSEYPDIAAFINLRDEIGDINVFKVKLFLVPIPEKNHYTVYCLNMVDFRIDILDSSTEDHEGYHKVVGERVVPRLNELFRDLTDEEFKDFSNWKRPVTRVMCETEPDDSPFIAMKVMKIWDGNKLHSKENQVNMADLRSEMLYYMLYNTVNEAKNLPYGLEDYRPRELRLRARPT